MYSRRSVLSGFLGISAAPVLRAGEDVTIQGKLAQLPGKPPVLDTGSRRIPLSGDADTMGVLQDKRLAGATLELQGKFDSQGGFTVGPIHTRAVHVRRNGKKLLVTYWCDVCSIRTYTPGICWCCQEETALDLRESLPSDETR